MPEKKPAPNYGTKWTREHLILALELYFQIPFQETKASNLKVAQLAALIDRTPAAVARKLGNFGSLDPKLGMQKISGLGHTGRLDREVWKEFSEDQESLAKEAEALRQKHRSIE